MGPDNQVKAIPIRSESYNRVCHFATFLMAVSVLDTISNRLLMAILLTALKHKVLQESLRFEPLCRIGLRARQYLPEHFSTDARTTLRVDDTESPSV